MGSDSAPPPLSSNSAPLGVYSMRQSRSRTDKIASSARATLSSTSSTSGLCRPVTTGTHRLMMPAFSPAIAVSVSPRKAWWSIEIEVIAATAGRTTFVASSLPPSPTSITARSAWLRLNSINPAAVSASNTVIGRLALTCSSSAKVDASSPADTRFPAIRKRSVTETRCGDVITWTRSPAASPIARMVAHVLPLPFVPATWITGGSRCSGWPRWRSSACSRSRLRSIKTG